MDVRHYDPKNMSEDEVKMVERLQVSMSAGFVFRFLYVPQALQLYVQRMFMLFAGKPSTKEIGRGCSPSKTPAWLMQHLQANIGKRLW